MKKKIIISVIIGVIILFGFFGLRKTAKILLVPIQKTHATIRTRMALWRHDPGQCAMIGNYIARLGNTERYRDECIKRYTASITRASDCGTVDLPTTHDVLQNLSKVDYFRMNCLLDHYKYMLGNALVKNWLPEKCTALTEKIVVMSYYLRQAYVANLSQDEIRVALAEPFSQEDAKQIESCVATLDTPMIYRFLHGDFSPEIEKNYIEEQKRALEIQ